MLNKRWARALHTLKVGITLTAAIVVGLLYIDHEKHQTKLIGEALVPRAQMHTVKVYDLPESTDKCVLLAVKVALNADPFFERNEGLILEAFNRCIE